MTTVSITFEDENNKLHLLNFILYNSSLAKRWCNLVKKNQTYDNKYIHSSFINTTYENVYKVLSELNFIAGKINQEYDIVLPLFQNIYELDQPVLNDLHEQYEIYGNRLNDLIKAGKWSSTLHDNFLRLNELVHDCEEVIRNKDDPFTSMSVLFDYYPQELHQDILEKDKIYLSNKFQWGKLYLGYNTLGKDWLEVQRHNDLDVIARHAVRPQRRFAAEAWINFIADDNSNFSNVMFENWYDELPKDIQAKVPMNNLSELCLGRFEIGTIAITPTLLEFHNNVRDWYSISHPVKNRWNKEVFSTFKKIINITFIN